MAARRLVCLPHSFGGDRFMEDLFDNVVLIHSVTDLHKTDVVLFEGGTDISPKLYGETPSKYTQHANIPRDVFEVAVWNKAQKAGAACFGICRGAQLFTALNGGKLIQHVSGHGHANHPIQTKDGEILETSSVHHQMMAPGGTKYELLAWAAMRLSKVYLGEDNKDAKNRLDSTLGLEPEAIWFPETRSLGVQGHPEFLPAGHEFQHYCRRIIQKYIFNEKVTN